MSSGLTNFPNGISSFGAPVVPHGIPFSHRSKVIHCAPYRTTANGASDSYDGSKRNRAVKTLTKALSLARADYNDVVLMYVSGEAAAETTDDQSATLAWSKDQVHLVGVHAGTRYGQRARIQPTASVGSVSPLFNLTGSGCRIHGIHFFCGGEDTNLIAFQNTGNHNVVSNCHIAGGGTTAIAGAAGGTSLKCNGGSECVFLDCIIGLDTTERDADFEGELWFDTGASRYWFENCLFTTYLSADNQTVKLEDGTAIDRTIMFKDCTFFAKSTNKAVAQTTVFQIPAGISQGAIILRDSYAASDGGAVDWDSSNRGIIWNNSVAAAASAAGGILTNQ